MSKYRKARGEAYRVIVQFITFLRPWDCRHHLSRSRIFRTWGGLRPSKCDVETYHLIFPVCDGGTRSECHRVQIYHITGMFTLPAGVIATCHLPTHPVGRPDLLDDPANVGWAFRGCSFVTCRLRQTQLKGFCNAKLPASIILSEGFHLLTEKSFDVCGLYCM